MTSHLESTGLHEGQAATFTSGFWLALVTGRVLMTLMPARVPEQTTVRVRPGRRRRARWIQPSPRAARSPPAPLLPIFPTGIVWLANATAPSSLYRYQPR